MSHFIKYPNLPEGKVESIICGTKDRKIIDFFQRRNIRVITSSPNKNIEDSVSLHADMAALHIGKDEIVIDKNQTVLYEELIKSGMTVYLTENAIVGEYPSDVGLNFTLINDLLVGKLKCADPAVKGLLDGKNMINVNQGYCKCSMLVVDENSVITDDESIHRKIQNYGIESLLISKGDITLNGHEYGFIGGASGKISKEEIVFFGDIRNHSNYAEIASFIETHGCRFCCTDEDNLRDIGGFISITED